MTTKILYTLIISVLVSGCSYPSQKELSKGPSRSSGQTGSQTASSSAQPGGAAEITPSGGTTAGGQPNTTGGENAGATTGGPMYYGIDELDLSPFIVSGSLSETLLADAFKALRVNGFNLVSLGIFAGDTQMLSQLLGVAADAKIQLILWLNESCPVRNHASTPWCFAADIVDPSATDPSLGWDISRGAVAMALIDAHNADRPDDPTVLGVVATHEPFYSANIHDINDDISSPIVREKIASRVAGLYERLSSAYPNVPIAAFFTAIAGLNGTETAPYLDYWVDAVGSTPAGGGEPQGRRFADIAITFQHCEIDAAAAAAGDTTFRGACDTIADNNRIDRDFLDRYENLKSIKLIFNMQAFGSACYHKAMPSLVALADRACNLGSSSSGAPSIDGLMYYAWDDPTAGTLAANFPIDLLSITSATPNGVQCLPTPDPNGGILGVYEQTLSQLPNALTTLAYDTIFSVTQTRCPRQ